MRGFTRPRLHEDLRPRSHPLAEGRVGPAEGGALHGPEAYVRDALAGRYALQRELGRGGMATVYLADDLRHRRSVAIKVLRPELAATLGPDRFLREIEVTAQLHHPMILPLLDSGEAHGTLYYVMPFVEGESLRERLNREQQLSLDEALRITKDVAEALGYAHSRGVVHRDIKPENILLESGHALVADFGIATALAAAGGARLTETGMSVGTPAYMSPEQGAGAKHLDGRSDIYSLGCVLYEMLAGEPPFTGPSAQAILARQSLDPVPRLRTVRESVPEALEAAVMQALAKVPADRFATVQQFIESLIGSDARGASASRKRAMGTLAGSAAVVLVLARVLVLVLGLPAWLWDTSMVVVAAGMPALLLGEWRGWGRRRRWLTQQRAFALGGAGVLALALSGMGYLASRSFGVGPFATPISRGQVAPQVRLVVAHFAPVGVDTNLADAVTELMRADLLQSPVLHALSPSEQRTALIRMERTVNRLDAGTAQELAQREGLSAVLAGEVRQVGGRYLLLATMTSVADGTVLVSERETARDSTDLIDAAERLSRRLRDRTGESFRAIRASAPLWQVTTASLAALRAFSAATELEWVDLNHPRALPLLEEAVAQDSTFAAAYRKMSVVLINNGRAAEGQVAADRAFRFRDRLPEMERLSVEGSYYHVHRDLANAEAAFRRMSELDSTRIQPFIRLADIRLQQRRFAEAEAFGLHALVDMGSRSMATRGNVLEAQVAQRRFAAAESVAAQSAPTMLGYVLTARRDYARAEAFYDSLVQHGEPSYDRLALLATVQGRLAEAERLWERYEECWDRSDPGCQGIRSWERDFWWPLYDLFYRGDTAHAVRRLDALRARAGWDSQAPVQRQYAPVIALLAWLGRTAEARALLMEWKAITPPHPALVSDVGLAEGAIAQADGNVDSAVAAFLRWHEAPFATSEHPFNRGLVEAAGVLDRLGRTDSAIVLYERALDLPYLNGMFYEVAWYPFVLRRLAELHASLGHRERAVEYWSRFIDLWSHADTELQPDVREARAALARLTGESPR